MDLVSIIVPCYLQSDFLPETLDSVLSQTYTNWECIIVNDGSTDATEQVAKTYCKRDPRFKYIYQRNRGLSSARNTGLINARGKFIQFLDSDDLISPDKLFHQVDTLIKNEEVDIVYGETLYFDSNEKDRTSRSIDFKNKRWMPCISGKGRLIIEHLLRRNIMVVSSPLIKRSVIDEVGYFNEDLRALEDWFYWLKCALKDKFFLYTDSAKAITHIRVHSLSMSKDKDRMLIANTKIRNKLHLLLKHDKYLFKLNREIYLYSIGESAFNEIKQGNFIRGFVSLIELSFRYQEFIYFTKTGAHLVKAKLRSKVLSNSNYRIF